jgi:hypothetical protein
LVVAGSPREGVLLARGGGVSDAGALAAGGRPLQGGADGAVAAVLV